MAHNVLRGIPALASPSGDDTSSWCQCSLVVKVNVACTQATIQLLFILRLHGFETAQRISLVYDADNFVPGRITLSKPELPPVHISKIARNNCNEAKSLRLVLRQPCTVLCPRASTSIAPEDGSDPNFQRVVNVAKATKLDIVFDYDWLHPDKHAQLHSLFGASEWSRFPREHAAKLRETDWTVFTPGEPALPANPPTYESLKRLRESRTSSPEASLTAKRQLLEPPSPTEKATTTTATPSPRLFSPPPLGGLSEEEVNRAVAKLLPDAVRTVLAEFAGQLPVPTSSPSPRATPAPPNLGSALKRLIDIELTTHADKITDICDTAGVMVEEQLEDYRLEVTVLKEDGLLEIDQRCDAKLQELSDHMAELAESARMDIEDAYMSARDRLDELWRRTPERRGSSAGQRLRRVSSSPL